MAAGSTYTPIATTTLGSSATSYTFTSIPSTYTDLVLIGNFGTTTANNSVRFQVGNGSIDTAANYSYTFMYGNGSSAVSTRGSSDTSIYSGYTINANIENMWNIHFQNYSNTTTKKTMLERYNQAAGATTAIVGLWNSTSAINQIRALSLGDPFSVGSTFTLYGIASA
jgi:hypothetical protein